MKYETAQMYECNIDLEYYLIFFVQWKSETFCIPAVRTKSEQVSETVCKARSVPQLPEHVSLLLLTHLMFSLLLFFFTVSKKCPN